MTRWAYLKNSLASRIKKDTSTRNRHGKKCEFNGQSFDSKTELDFYLYLLAEKQAGHIQSIELQPVTQLQPTFKKHGETIRAITYKPDFLVTYTDGRKEYIDVKGYAEEDAELKRKVFIYTHDTPLKWVAAAPEYMNSPTGWCDYFELRREKEKRKRLLNSQK